MDNSSGESTPPHPPPAYEVEGPAHTPSTSLPTASPAAVRSASPSPSHRAASPLSPSPSPATPPAATDHPTPTHILTFHHAHCALCSSTTLFEHVITSANFADLQLQMTARVYDLLEIMHPDGPDVVDGFVRLSLAKAEEPDDEETMMMVGLEDMDYLDRATLLDVLAEGGESYRLGVEFATVGAKAEDESPHADKQGEAAEPEDDIYSSA